MTVKVAKNNHILRKRLLRFFAKQCRQKNGLYEFLNHLSEHADVLLFGGAIRDIALNGIRQFDSDLDFVFVGEAKLLTQLLTKQPLQANKFGGYRLQFKQLLLDIWPIQETWAFKQSLVDYHSIASLLNTTITNWDAILFSWREKKLIFPEHYFDHLEQGYLDVVLEVNPNELGLLVRILRHFVLKEAHIFSPRLSRLVYQKIKKYDFARIAEHEKLSYRENYITPNLIDYLKNNLSAALENDQAVILDKFNQTLPLFNQ